MLSLDLARTDGTHPDRLRLSLRASDGRLEGGGLLESRWEDPELAVEEGRPRRRLYRVTPLGARALAEARAAESPSSFRPGLVT